MDLMKDNVGIDGNKDRGIFTLTQFSKVRALNNVDLEICLLKVFLGIAFGLLWVYTKIHF